MTAVYPTSPLGIHGIAFDHAPRTLLTAVCSRLSCAADSVDPHPLAEGKKVGRPSTDTALTGLSKR